MEIARGLRVERLDVFSRFRLGSQRATDGSDLVRLRALADYTEMAPLERGAMVSQ